MPPTYADLSASALSPERTHAPATQSATTAAGAASTAAPVSNAAQAATTAVGTRQRRGFAAMDPAKQREIAGKGGRASHAKGTGHEWSSAEARAAGALGGKVSRGGRGKAPEVIPDPADDPTVLPTGRVVVVDRTPPPTLDDSPAGLSRDYRDGMALDRELEG